MIEDWLDKVAVGKIKMTKVPAPRSPEQRHVAAEVDLLMAVCAALEAKFTRSSTKVEHLASASVQHLTPV